MFKLLITTALSLTLISKIYAHDPLHSPTQTITVGNHTLTITDTTGKSCVEHVDQLKFKWIYDKANPCLPAPQPTCFELRNYYACFVNSTGMKIEEDERGNLTLTETDTQPATEQTYYVKLSDSFLDLYKQFSNDQHFFAKYLRVPTNPNSAAFEREQIIKLVKDCYSPEMIEQIKKQTEVEVFSQTHDVTASDKKYEIELFYNQHGIVATHRVEYYFHMGSKKIGEKMQNICLIYQNPATKEASTFRTSLIMNLNPTASIPDLYCYLHHSPLKGYALINDHIKDIFVLSDGKQAFLNGEPATHLHQKELVDLWEEQIIEAPVSAPINPSSKPKGKTITVGEHTLLISDKTGKFSIVHSPESSSPGEIVFRGSFDDQFPYYPIVSNLSFQLHDAPWGYANSTKITVRNKSDHIVIKETDTRSLSTFVYFVKIDDGFKELYKQYLNSEKNSLSSNYLLIPYRPNAQYLNEEQVKAFLKKAYSSKDISQMKKPTSNQKPTHYEVSLFNDVYNYDYRDDVLYYNQHGIMTVQTDGDPKFTKMTIRYQNPFTHEISKHETVLAGVTNNAFRNRYKDDSPCCYTALEKASLKAIVLPIFGRGKVLFLADGANAYLNAMPATVCNKQKIVSLWEEK